MARVLDRRSLHVDDAFYNNVRLREFFKSPSYNDSVQKWISGSVEWLEHQRILWIFFTARLSNVFTYYFSRKTFFLFITLSDVWNFKFVCMRCMRCIFWVVIMFVKVSNISDVSNIKTRMLFCRYMHHTLLNSVDFQKVKIKSFISVQIVCVPLGMIHPI